MGAGKPCGKAGTQPSFPHGDMVAGGELLEKEEVRGFIEYAKGFGFEIIPEVQFIWACTVYNICLPRNCRGGRRF